MEEIGLCKPKIILTLGQEVAWVVSGKRMPGSGSGHAMCLYLH
jgi:uracil-DNA glycosylase